MRVLPGPSWETGHRSPACKQNALRRKRRSPPAFRRKGKSCRVSPRPPPTVWHELFSRVPEKRPQCLSPARTSGEPRCFQNEIAHTQMKKKKKIPSARPHWTENGSGGCVWKTPRRDPDTADRGRRRIPPPPEGGFRLAHLEKSLVG